MRRQNAAALRLPSFLLFLFFFPPPARVFKGISPATALCRSQGPRPKGARGCQLARPMALGGTAVLPSTALASCQGCRQPSACGITFFSVSHSQDAVQITSVEMYLRKKSKNRRKMENRRPPPSPPPLSLPSRLSALPGREPGQISSRRGRGEGGKGG